MADGEMSKDEDKNRRAPQRGVFERPAGSGVWWVCYFDEHGRRHREKVGPKGLAQDVYRKRKNDIRESRFFPEDIRRREVLLADMIDDYLDRVKGKLRSYRECKRAGKNWKAALPGKTLRQIQPGDIERAVAKRAAEVSPATINRSLAFLKRVFNVAIADGCVEQNPVRKVKLFKENNARVRFLTAEEETTLFTKLEDTDQGMVLVALHTGFRQAEQFGLRWEHVDFATGIMTVPRSKSGETRRVPMNDIVRGVLRALPSRMKSAWVFPSATGETPLDARNYVSRVFQPALKEASVQGFRWHDLRHTFASRLVMAGVDLRTVQELMGHKTLVMTLRYAHLSASHQLDAVQRLVAQPSATRTATSDDAAKVVPLPTRATPEEDEEIKVGRGGIEPPTRRFSVCCSTD